MLIQMALYNVQIYHTRSKMTEISPSSAPPVQIVLLVRSLHHHVVASYSKKLSVSAEPVGQKLILMNMGPEHANHVRSVAPEKPSAPAHQIKVHNVETVLEDITRKTLQSTLVRSVLSVVRKRVMQS